MKNGKRLFPFILGGAGLCLVAAAVLLINPSLLVATEKSESAAKSAEVKPVTVTVSPVVPRKVQRLVNIVGSLYGKEEIPISPEVDGRIVRIHHDVGDVVKPGEVLFEIDPRTYELTANEAQRTLELEMAKLGLKTIPETDEGVDVEVLPNVTRAKLQLKLIELQHTRSSQLWAQKTISKEEWDKVETDLKLAKNAFDQAVLDARSNWASMRQKQAIVDTAREKLSRTRVVVPSQSNVLKDHKGPVQYVVAERTVTEGEMVSAMRGNTPAFRLVIADPLKLEAAVAERFASEIKVGQTAGLKTEATGDKIHYGKVTRVNPTVDRASRTFHVEIEITNKDRDLPPGSFAKASVETRVDDKALTVPAESIVRFAGVIKVFVIRDGKSQGIPVKLGQRIEETDGKEKGRTHLWFEVMGDIKPDDVVATSGQSQLANDTPVTIRDSSSPGKEKT